MKRHLTLCLVILCTVSVIAQTAYQRPPKEILDVLEAPTPPAVSVSPTRDYVILEQTSRYPSIADLAEPMLRLAGHRINPKTNAVHNEPRIIGMTVKKLDTGVETKVALPAGAKASGPRWSPDGKQFAFTNSTSAGVELWVGTTATAAVRRVAGVRLNTTMGAGGGFGGGPGGGGGGRGGPVQWMPGSKQLLVRTVPAGRGPAPDRDAPPTGPNIQQSTGKLSAVWTFQDLLKGVQDEKLFEYYFTSQLALVDVATGTVTPVGKPGIFDIADASPDGKHLLVSRIHRPFSYLYTSSFFPKDIEIWDPTGKLEHKVASLPLADSTPVDGVPTGPRQFQWKSSEAATLVWAEALDGGDPKAKVPHRDRLMTLAAPFTGSPQEAIKLEQRFAGLQWGETGIALLRDSERERRRTRTYLWEAGAAPKLIFDRGQRDRYNDPGNPITKTLPNGEVVLMQSGDNIFLTGLGSSPDGDRPFLDRFNLKTLQKERLFRSDSESYETVVALLDADGSRIVTRRESRTDPPNYFIRRAGSSNRQAITTFKDPSPQIRSIKGQLVKYKRADGVECSFILYLPPDYRPGTPLPTFIWAYPLEFEDPSTAGQVSGSTQRFFQPSGPSHLLLALHGYAVLDNASMPVVGDFRTANNTYVEQIVMSAKAAIDKAVEMGVTDPKRVGVGGHSYGAFMTANLLANSDLFKAGVARSGAYNRTLTPFGFQSERRTFWEAPDIYIKMSPFARADKIKTPILFIHGEADNNSGTFPIQSERMYAAVRGHGGTARLVMLPHESHGYAAKESVEHTLAETVAWLDKYLKDTVSASVR